MWNHIRCMILQQPSHTQLFLIITFIPSSTTQKYWQELIAHGIVGGSIQYLSVNLVSNQKLACFSWMTLTRNIIQDHLDLEHHTNQKRLLRMELSVLLMLHDLNDLGCLILIHIPHKCNLQEAQSRYFLSYFGHIQDYL